MRTTERRFRLPKPRKVSQERESSTVSGLGGFWRTFAGRTSCATLRASSSSRTRQPVTCANWLRYGVQPKNARPGALGVGGGAAGVEALGQVLAQVADEPVSVAVAGDDPFSADLDAETREMQGLCRARLADVRRFRGLAAAVIIGLGMSALIAFVVGPPERSLARGALRFASS